MEIYLMQQGHPFWDKTIELAENCSWKAGHYLAKRMKENAFLSWERVVAICDGEIVVGFCTLTEKDELPDRFDYKPFIGYIFVDERFRGNRYSEKMINQVEVYAKELGYAQVYIMSGERGLYEKFGFVKLGDCVTIYGVVDQLFQKTI